VSSDLEQVNGGFDTADEAPEFAAAAEFDAADIEPDTAVADTTMAPDPSSAGGPDMLVVWGKMPADPDETAKHDWTGSLTLSSGALAVQRTIAFEDKTDAVLPRTSPGAVSFTSVTRPFVDGLALRVFEPSASAVPPTLTYAPADGSASIVFDLGQLVAGPIVVDTADGDKMVAIGIHRDDTCHHGFMRGRWHAISANLGAYLGRVTDRAGATIGHVRGIYGQKQDGTPVMYGKFIDTAGKFVGIIAGKYENGDYQAHWIDRAGDHGRLHGHYFEATGAERGGFIGRWAESTCSDDQP
jgi:hypothetical protein